MKANYEDFINQNSNCKKFSDSPSAIYIFEHILSKESNIIAMIDEACAVKKTALSICAAEIEEYHDKNPHPSFDLNDNFTKQAVGRMVKTILAPFGYVTSIQKDMSKNLGLKYFTSATVFKFSPDQPATLFIKKVIMDKEVIEWCTIRKLE